MSAPTHSARRTEGLTKWDRNSLGNKVKDASQLPSTCTEMYIRKVGASISNNSKP